MSHFDRLSMTQNGWGVTLNFMVTFFLTAESAKGAKDFSVYLHKYSLRFLRPLRLNVLEILYISDLEALAFFQGLDKVGGIQHGVEGARIQPGKASLHDLDLQGFLS